MKISILLVEDEAPKRTHIERFIHKLSSDFTITFANSVNTAIDMLEIHIPDLLLLDMSLPTFEIGDRERGGVPQTNGGTEILRHMSLAEISCPTIVITGYEAFPREAGRPVNLSGLRAELENEFPQSFKGILHYNSTYDEWKIELGLLLTKLGFLPGK